MLRHLTLIALTSCSVTWGLEKSKSDSNPRLQAALKKPTVGQLPLFLEQVQKKTHCFPQQSASVRAIQGLGQQAVPEIVSRIQHGSRTWRTWKMPVQHIYLLAMIGPPAKGAIPALDEMVARHSRSRYVRHFAETAKASIKGDVNELARLATQTWDVGYVAVQVLESLGAAAHEAAPALAKAAMERGSSAKRCLKALQKIDAKLAKQVSAEIKDRQRKLLSGK